MDEDELRELMGFPGSPEVHFAGQEWKLRDDGLFPLLRYVKTQAAKKGGEGGAALAALYQLLADCVVDFAAFSGAAYESKADIKDIETVMKTITEIYCARKFWPAMRLIGYVAQNVEEIDGNLIAKGGVGVARLSAREACNLALALCLDGSSEEDRETFTEDLNFEGSPEADAMAMVRQMQADRKAREAEAQDG